MAYDDKDDTKFPTRFGQATGRANERTMLDELNGANGIRHRQRMGADGVTTHVKTRGGHPHFWNEPLPKDDEEPVSPIYMDSGAIDLLSVNPANPLSYLASPLYYSDDQRAAFAAEKLLGKITPPEITNLDPPVDTEPGESFTPVTGGDLIGKKDCAAKCPPSMFTGKARLYAQAQLGAPLRKWGWTIDLPEGQAPRWIHDSTGFVLDINVGVYTDDTDKHWLISVSGSGVMVTPLKPSKSAKLLRPNLSDPAYTADKTKIEAYILAHSVPGGASESFFVTVSDIPPPYMLGYGWKFNWDGSSADIIKHIEGSPQHSSTHYRLSINRQTSIVSNIESNRWTFSVSVVEGPVYWHNYKFDDVICAPEWLSNTLYTFGTLWGGDSGNAPIYCFYKANNSLEVVRYKGSGGESNVMYSGVSDPACWFWVFDWSSDNPDSALEGGTYGSAGADGERRMRTHNPRDAGFYSTAVTATAVTQAFSFNREYIGPKVHTGNTSGDLGGAFGHNAYEQEGILIENGRSLYETLADGVSVYTSTASIQTNTGAYLGYAMGNIVPYLYEYNVQRESWSGTETESSLSLVVVPFHDAEAFYIWANKNKYRYQEGNGGNVTGWHNGGVFYSYTTEVFYVEPTTDPVTYWYHTNYYAYGGGISHQVGSPSDGLAPQTTSEDTLVASRLVTRNGDYDFSSPISLNAFFAGNDFIEQTFYTRSAIHGAMYGFGASNPEGISATFTSPPPFIGWI